MKTLFLHSATGNRLMNLLKREVPAIISVVILMLLMLATRAEAAPRTTQHATVEISMWDNSEFVILFDNQSFGNRTHIVLGNVSPGRHQVKIYKRLYDRGSRQHRMHLLLDETIVVRARENHVFQVNRSNRLVPVRTTQPVQPVQPERPVRPQYRPAPVVHQPIEHEPEVFYSGPAVISQQEFASISQMVKNASFENTRMTLIKQAVGGRAVTSQQVLDLMKLMSFESTRLELAKWAYPIAYDRENYYIVNQGFTFSSSIHELANFMGQN